MACHPCWEGTGNRTKEGYRRRLTGNGSSFRERKQERVACGECGAELAAGSLSGHMMTRHGKAAPRQHLWAPQTTGGPRIYKMNFPTKGGRRQCPVEGCPGCQRHKRRCGCTSCTGTSTTLWSYWMRATSPYHGARLTRWQIGSAT